MIVLLEYSDLFLDIQFHIDCSIRVSRSFSLIFNLTGKDSQYTEIILPIMLALCLMLSGTYYAQNYDIKISTKD